MTIPNFDVRHSCVLVNLNSLECEEVIFSSSLSPPHPNPELERLLSEEKESGSVMVAGEEEEEEGATLMQDLMGDSDDDMDM